MKTSSNVVFLGMSALTGALVLGSSLEGCRNDAGSTGFFTTSQTGTTTGTAGSGTGGGTAVTTVTIQQITNQGATGYVGPKTLVKVAGTIAMSTKFLVSKGSSGTCLWGVFVSDPHATTTGPNTGMLALSYGTLATAGDAGGTAYCPVIQANQPAGDSFPDDVGPGDVLDIYGETDSYIPAACSAGDAGPGASQIPGIQITKVNHVDRAMANGMPVKATLPTPAVLTSSDLATLAAGSDTTWFSQWGNVRVEVDKQTVENQQTGLTDKYGHMILQVGTNGIQVGDKLYYVGYVKATDACYSGPSYPTVPPFQLDSVTGFVYLDYCNWGIIPSNKCHDLAPPSDDCASVADAGADANPAAVCLH